MHRPLLILILALNALTFPAFGETLIWKGAVSANGNPSESVKLVLNQNYQIKVAGFVNLGKWMQNREKLANDACSEFSKIGETEHLVSFKNSLSISVCDGKYHPDHVYLSEPFLAKENRIHFWVYDTDYDDNEGVFNVEVFQMDDLKIDDML